MKEMRSFGKLAYFSIILFFLISALVFTISSASGRPFRLGKIPDQGKNFNCQTCHDNPRGGRDLSPFGTDYKKIGLKAGDKYTEELGKLDSDGDGFTNDAEFAAKTNPGDSNSKPAN